MNYMGDFLEDATVYITFNTFDSNDPSASVTITDLVSSDVEIWKNGVVQTTPGAGVTITLNIGTNNGTHLIVVDTSNTTDGGFYVISADYQVRINGTTIDGATVNAWVGSFSIENRFKEVNVTQIDGDATSGYNATLKLKSLDIQNSAGSAFIAKSTGSNGHGMDVAGNGSGEGLKATGGLTGRGGFFTGGATSGRGVSIQAGTGSGQAGLYCGGDGSSVGLEAVGGSTGSGTAFTAGGGNGYGLYCTGKGSGSGLYARNSNGTGDGILSTGGPTGGAGIKANALADNDAGMELVKHGTGKDLDADDLSSYTSTRAGYIDNLSAGAVALASVVGALNDAAAAGDPTTNDTLMKYIKQLINVLIGSTGAVAFPAEQAPANGINLLEVLRAIHADVTGLNGSAMIGTNGANTVEPDATGTAAGLHATTDAKIDTTDGLIGGLNNVSVANLNTACDTVTVTSMANDVITAASINTGAIAADAVASTALDNIVMSDLAQGAPSATASIVTAINVLYEAFRNKTLTTATLVSIMKDNGTTTLMKSTISDAAGTTTKNEFVSGA